MIQLLFKKNITCAGFYSILTSSLPAGRVGISTLKTINFLIPN